jgi:hypothetical protein
MIMSRIRRRFSSSPGHKKDTGESQRRHAIFYDVENTSSPSDVDRVVALLEVDRARCDTHLVAVGNWRVIGQETARLLARQGAELVHSAPSTGVRDWSDLRIAVDVGIWLGAAKPGDMVDIVSDDQAFDAIGDVAATLGVVFRRIPARNRMVVAREPSGRTSAATSVSASPGPRPAASGARQASHDDILMTLRRMMAHDPTGHGTVSLDSLSNALKDAGFGRAPGSFRLITRLRRMKELRIGGEGVIRFASPEDARPDGEMPAPLTEVPKPRRRRGRRGGRRRGGHPREVLDAEPADDEPPAPDVAG